RRRVHRDRSRQGLEAPRVSESNEKAELVRTPKKVRDAGAGEAVRGGSKNLEEWLRRKLKRTGDAADHIAIRVRGDQSDANVATFEELENVAELAEAIEEAIELDSAGLSMPQAYLVFLYETGNARP